MDVYVLASRGQHQAEQVALDMLIVERYREVVADERAAQRERVHRENAVASLIDVRSVDLRRHIPFILQLVVVDVRRLSNEDLLYAVCEVAHIAEHVARRSEERRVGKE